MTRIKLCGLTRLCDIEEANSLMPDYIGFVFAAKSKRYISPEAAGRLREALNPSVCVSQAVRVRSSTGSILQGLIGLTFWQAGWDPKMWQKQWQHFTLLR